MRNIIKEKILKQRKRLLTVALMSGVMAAILCGCDFFGKDITKEEISETIGTEVSDSMETVFMDSRYVSGDTIDEFIENQNIKEIIVVNKFSENDDEDYTKQKIQRDSSGYVLDGNTYKYFYKLTHNVGKAIFQEYILSDIIIDAESYDNYILSSTKRQGDPVVVATNILDEK